MAMGFIICFQQGNNSIHRWEKVFELDFFIRNIYARWSNQAGTIVLPAGQFALYPASYEIPEIGTCYIDCRCKLGQRTLSKLVHLTHLAK